MSRLWENGPDYQNSGGAFPLTTDAILLADFAAGKNARRALEIGCGSGIVSLLLAWNEPKLRICAVDISRVAAGCAMENMRVNRLDDRVEVVCADITRHMLPEGEFELAVANPPYYAEGAGKPAGFEREEQTLTLCRLAQTASRALKNGGSLCMVHKPHRLADIFEALRGADMEPKRMRFVSHTAQSAPALVLIDARLGGRPSLETLPPLILKNGDGGDSDEIKRIYRMT